MFRKVINYFVKQKMITKIISLLGALIGGIGLILTIADNANNIGLLDRINNTINPIQNNCFPPNSKSFKVLFVPFLEISQEDKQDISCVIKMKLDEFKKNYGLDIITYYHQVRITQNFNDDSAKYLLNSYKADMIVYGNYRENDSKYKVNCKFYVSNKWKNIIKTNEMKNQSNDDLVTISDIEKGHLQGDIIFSLFFISGYSEYRKSNYKKSLIFLNEAVNYNPNSAFCYYILGQIHLVNEDYKKSITSYDKAIKLKPTFSEAYIDRGVAYFNMGDKRSAIKDFNKATILNPKSAHNHFFRGLLYYSKNDLRNALNDYNEAIKLINTDTSSTSQVGRTFRYSMNYSYEHSDLVMGKTIFYFSRGKAFQSINDMDNAIMDYSEAIKLFPQFADAYISRGICHIEKNDSSEAMSDLYKAFELRPDDKEIWSLLSLASRRVKGIKNIHIQ